MKRFILFILLVCSGLPLQAKVVDKEVIYRAAKTSLKGYVAYDDSFRGRRPAVLVVHEWWGHNDYARKRARMLAKLGYVAFSLDMYGDGKLAAHPKDAGRFSGAIKNDMPLARARFQAALTQLHKHPLVDKQKTAAIGYCFGGGIVLQMARQGVDLDAVVSFHGSLTTQQPAQKGKVKARVLVLNGEADPFVKAEQIDAFKQEMRDANVRFDFISYPGAMHAFTNPAATELGKKFKLPLAYHQQADVASWQKMQDFLAEVFR